ncbi:MAG: glycosyltransferase [Candidatus Thermochlorobacter sp.]
MPKYSIIIPVYNRPDEVKDLLESLLTQDTSLFEVIVVEDGSTIDCQNIVSQFSDKLSIQYHQKPNEGPGLARNYGAKFANGEYLIFLDSDCTVNDNYFSAIEKAIHAEHPDLFGGPDRAHRSFTDLQKAISYAMTSFITTGGIRGGKKKLDTFYPRSFNMGVRKSVFDKVGGFSAMRFGEDLDLSLRLVRLNLKSILIPEAFVYHKRRSTLKQFFKQVFNSGSARITLYQRHPNSLKLVHILPALFLIFSFLVVMLSLLHPSFSLILLLIALIFFTDALRSHSLKVSTLAVIASFVQLWAYGLGFMYGLWGFLVLGKQENKAFEKNFYK